MKPEIHARLTITGEFDPADVTQRLGIEPRRTRRKGEPVLRSKPDARCMDADLWESAWSEGTSPFAESFVTSLIDTFWPKREALRRLADDHGAVIEVSVAIYIFNDNRVHETPAIHLEPGLIQRVAELGARIDFDLYVMLPPDPSSAP